MSWHGGANSSHSRGLWQYVAVRFVDFEKVSKREKGIYTIACLICLYMGMDFVVNKDWFDFFDLMIPVFEDISKAIDGFLNVNA